MDVVCPQCTTQFSAEPGRIATCPRCGYSGGQVPGVADVSTYQPDEKFLPDEVDPAAESEEDEDGERGGEGGDAPKETSRIALTAMILGLSIPIPFAGPVAVAFGIGGIAQVKRHEHEMKGIGMAVIGIVFGALASIAWFMALVGLFAGAGRLVTGG